MSDFLDRFVERNRAAFWPWLLLVGALVLIGFFLYEAGQRAQHAIDPGGRVEVHHAA